MLYQSRRDAFDRCPVLDNCQARLRSQASLVAVEDIVANI